MKLHAIWLVTATCALSACPASAYELATHGAITREAFSISVLNDVAFRANLGLPESGDPFGSFYYDTSWNDVRQRSVSESFEGEIIKKKLGVDPLSVGGWLMRGAIREDDYILWDAPNPQDDPFNTNDQILDNRPFHHFFDPLRNIGLFGIGKKAPDWAIGSSDAFNSPNTPESYRRNHFTKFDAREAMFRALTGRDKQGNPVATSAAERNKYWATTFRALGDVLHLNQDMAQPQHTRNDPHSGKSYSGNVSQWTGHKSFFEAYIEQRATGEKFTVPNGDPVAVAPLKYQLCDAAGQNCSPYPIPQFTKYSDFWSTAPGTTGGNGLADYSNRGFFTAGTNLGKNEYNLPSNDAASYAETVLSPGTGKNMAGVAIDGEIRFKTGGVNDTLNVGLSASSQPLTTYGVWDQFLIDKNQPPDYTLNYYNYDAMADLLIPRAVSYSAGLINYFFRGKLEISLPDEGVYAIVDHAVENQPDTSGFRTLKLKLRNITPAAAGGTEPIGAGTLRAVAKFHRNTCYQPDLSGEYGAPTRDWHTCRAEAEEIVVSESVAVPAGIDAAAQAVAFTFGSPIPINATDLYLQVVYRGPLGQEADAVVVATKDIAEPGFQLGYYNADEQFLYGPTCDGCVLKTFKEVYCDSVQPPIPYDQCKYDNRYSYYLRFTPPPSFDPQNPIASFGATVSLTDIPVSQYARIAVLTDIGSFPVYTIGINPVTGISQSSYQTYSVGAISDQFDPTANDLSPTPYLQARGVFGSPSVYQLLNYSDPGITPPPYDPATPRPSAVTITF